MSTTTSIRTSVDEANHLFSSMLEVERMIEIQKELSNCLVVDIVGCWLNPSQGTTHKY